MIKKTFCKTCDHSCWDNQGNCCCGKGKNQLISVEDILKDLNLNQGFSCDTCSELGDLRKMIAHIGQNAGHAIVLFKKT